MAVDVSARLRAHSIPFEKDAPMAKRTTIRVGGPADYLIKARDPEDVRAALGIARETETPILFLGNGSNLLVRDEGIRGFVILIGGQMAKLRIEGTRLHAQAGASLISAAKAAKDGGLSGLEALSGIPGTVGGATRMNAGAYGGEMSHVVDALTAIGPDGGALHLQRDAMDFGYRRSAVGDLGLCVTSVVFELTPASPEAIEASMADFAKRRREKQPLTRPSAGSFFKRPEGHFAGALIEGAGLKGLSVGGAKVSEKHAGFLVNTGGATATDFLRLMEMIQSRVYDKSGVRLEPEVRIL